MIVQTLAYSRQTGICAKEICGLRIENSTHTGPNDFVFSQIGWDTPEPRCPKARRALPDLGSPWYSAKQQKCGIPHVQAFRRNYRQPKNRKSETRPEIARALEPGHRGRRLHAYIGRCGSKCCARFRTGNLWRSVPSCSKSWNKEQQSGSELKTPCTRLYLQP